MGPIAGTKFPFGGLVKPDVVKTTGAEYGRDVMGSHVALECRRAGRLYQKGDFVENALIVHNLTLGAAA
jgi:hypothetical protein